MNALMIADTAIRQDDDGRYCLNDLHRASGHARRHTPNEWVRTQQTQELIAEIEQAANMRLALNVVHGGSGRGTYACKELVYSYAMWISPKFHLQVIRTFDAVVTQHAANDEFAQGAIADLQMTRVQMVQAVGDVFEHSIHIAELAGLTGASARFYADAATKRIIGVSPLELMNLKSLPAVSNDDQITFTPTELGKRFGMSPQEFNKLLEKAGLQTKTAPGTSPLRWKPTEKGSAHGRVVRVARKNNPAICEPALEWHETVIDELTNFARDLNQRLMPVTRG